VKLSFHGAARTVTGCRHLIETSTCRLLLVADCFKDAGRKRLSKTASSASIRNPCRPSFCRTPTSLFPVFGVPSPRQAQIMRLNGLSAHADRQDLLAYVRAINPLPGKVCIVHGEEKQVLSLASAVQAEHPKIDVQIPHRGRTHEIRSSV
jgi:Cft2 family RNA processing exonuclease